MVGYSIWRGIKVLLAFDSRGATDHNAPGQSNRCVLPGLNGLVMTAAKPL